jgi:hypothetical protein
MTFHRTQSPLSPSEEWKAWHTDNFIKEGHNYDRNKKFTVYTVYDIPMVIRDTGIE